MEYREFANRLLERDQFLILSHKNPDGDTLGSGAALCSALRRMGKTACVFRNEQITPRTEGYVAPYYAPEGFVPSAVIAVDIATPNLFPKGFDAPVDFCIDHHPTNSFYAGLTLLHDEKSSCGEAILELIETMTGSVTEEEASLLYIAVTTDTGCFQYMNTNADTMRCAARLIDFGADQHKIVHDFFRKVSSARLKLEGMIYSSMRFYRNDSIVTAVVTQQMLQDAGTTENDLDDLAGLPGRAEGGDLTILIRELPDGKSKCSLRSTPRVDSSAICAVYGGGGHHMAAGVTLDCPPREAEQLLLNAAEQEMPQ